MIVRLTGYILLISLLMCSLVFAEDGVKTKKAKHKSTYVGESVMDVKGEPLPHKIERARTGAPVKVTNAGNRSMHKDDKEFQPLDSEEFKNQERLRRIHEKRVRKQQ